ncbi:hypothetical protein A1F94_004850 [Pyrenophora tritici-repentis]|nr:hypothetical protein A1F94_004850 [Pyrenophora tritici-repentis]
MNFKYVELMFLATKPTRSRWLKAQTSLMETYIFALCDLQYDNNPTDRPHWLTGYHEVLTRFWVNEIERLEYLRSKRCPPEGQPTDGKWHYKHYGETIEVRRPALSGIGTPRTVYARGCWEYVVRGKKVWRGLDEWPMTLEGETLGWGTGVLQDHNKEERLRAEQLPKGEEE